MLAGCRAGRLPAARGAVPGARRRGDGLALDARAGRAARRRCRSRSAARSSDVRRPGARWTPLRLDASALRGRSVRLRVRSGDAAGLQLALIGTVQRAPALRVAKARRDPQDPRSLHVVIRARAGLAESDGADRDRARGRLPRGDRGAARTRPGGRAATLQAPLKRTAIRALYAGNEAFAPGVSPVRTVRARAGEAMIAHLDLDAFFAACEQLDRPELRGLPLIVGGKPESRGVVATASYEARAFGIGSGDELGGGAAPLPAGGLRPARPRALPRALAGGVGARAGSSARASSRSASTRAISISRRWCRTTLRARCSVHCRRRCGRPTGLGCSLGAGGSKTVAKIASDRRKPGGIVVVPPGRDARSSHRCRCGCCPASGRRRGGAPASRGLRDDRRSRRARLARARRCCSPARWGRGSSDGRRAIDERPVVVEPQEPVTISCEETFERDLVEPRAHARELELLAERVWGRLEHYDYRARTVTVKLRYPDFAIATRARTIEAPVESAAELTRIAVRAARPGARRPAGARPAARRGHGQARARSRAAAAAAARTWCVRRRPSRRRARAARRGAGATGSAPCPAAAGAGTGRPCASSRGSG